MSMDDTGDPSVDTSTADTGTATSDQSQSNDAFDLTDENRLIRVKGSDKPVKFVDHVRGFQSQFTKASQRAARLEQELQRERAARQAFEQERRAQPQISQQQVQNDPFAAIESLPYLSGKEASQVMRQIVAQIGDGTQQRDRVLLAALNKIKDMESRYGVLAETHASQTFESKINRWLEEGGYDKGLAGFAKHVYLSYEPGPELDEEFPQILKERVEEAQKVFEGQRTQKLNQARRQPFVPGKGAHVGPSKALEIRPDASPAEVADMLWESVRDPEKV